MKKMYRSCHTEYSKCKVCLENMHIPWVSRVNGGDTHPITQFQESLKGILSEK